jgi:hypothetical protein
MTMALPPEKKSLHLGERGGEEFDQKKFDAGLLRADLCELVQRYNFTNGAKAVDAILSQYTVKRRRVYGKN